MTTVVLGWDGLDHERAQEFGVVDAFGETLRPIDTITNDHLEKPHTWEIWPSIITGVPPSEHRIHAEEYIESNWSNPLVRWAAWASKPIPDAIRWRAGRWVRDSGAEMAFESDNYYRDRGLSTVFDDADATALAVPNYRSEADDRYELSADRGAELAAFMDTTTDESGETARTPTVDPETFLGRIGADAAEKVAIATHEARHGRGLVFVWLAYLDTAGHVAPTVADSEAFSREAYERAAEITRQVRAQLGAGDTLVCLSDHGLQNGAHTETAAIGGPESIVSSVEHVLDVRSALEATIESTGSGSGYERDESDHEAVQQRLKDLGYV